MIPSRDAIGIYLCGAYRLSVIWSSYALSFLSVIKDKDDKQRFYRQLQGFFTLGKRIMLD